MTGQAHFAAHKSALLSIENMSLRPQILGTPMLSQLVPQLLAGLVLDAAEHHDTRAATPRRGVLVVRKNHVHNPHPHPA